MQRSLRPYFYYVTELISGRLLSLALVSARASQLTYDWASIGLTDIGHVVGRRSDGYYRWTAEEKELYL